MKANLFARSLGRPAKLAALCIVIAAHSLSTLALAESAEVSAGSPTPAADVFRPMPIPVERSANQRWLNKPVLESRILDSMENASAWSHRGPGQMTFTAERVHEGRQSLRLTSPTITDKPNVGAGRPHGEATVSRHFNKEDWSTFNRISIRVYPTMPGFKIGSVVLQLHRELDETNRYEANPTHGGLHYALVQPNQWNHIVWEITHLKRDKVTRLDLTYRLQGNEPGAASTVVFDWDLLELQKVEPDYVEGWAVGPGRISFSHSGYATAGAKRAFAAKTDAKEFQVLDASGKTLLTKPVASMRTDLGEFAILDFSEFGTPGTYSLKLGPIQSQPFPITADPWRGSIWKTINLFYCERCGQKIPGIHDECHLDWQARHNDKTVPVFGGWHDAGDLSQGLINTGEATYAMFALAERLGQRDQPLRRRLVEEARYGLDWLLKTRFGDGYRVSWSTMDYWTDNQIGTPDDTFSHNVSNSPFDNATASAACAIAARVLQDVDQQLAKKSLEIAASDWQFAIEKPSSHIDAISAVALASVELFKATREQKYADKAAELANQIVSCQQQGRLDAAGKVPAGFFFTNARKDQILNYSHRAHGQGPIVSLAAACQTLPDHPQRMQWLDAVALHADYLVTVARYSQPYNLLPAGVHKLSGNPEQVSKGVKLTEEYYLRRFPTWGDLRGHYGILLSHTKSLSTAARLLNRPELFELVQDQLRWVVGQNPFAQSTMYGEGYDYAPQYTAMSGDMVGSLPVGIQTRGSEDVPYWPVTNCWNYKEVWVHPSSRWLFILADLVDRNQQSR
jgi:hypothetical protein